MESTPATRTKNRCSPRVARILRECLSGEGQSRARKAGANALLGASRRCPQRHGEEPAAGLPERPIWAGPGSTRREAGRSRRIYMTLYIDEKRGDARPRTSRNVG